MSEKKPYLTKSCQVLAAFLGGWSGVSILLYRANSRANYITMGLGTRFANGCNVGTLYTPIANFSLSGWIFLIFMVIGGIIGNNAVKKWFKRA
jgi:hypothetical protein